MESLRSSLSAGKSQAEISAAQQKDEAILIQLAKLALMYWRPDFTPGQAKQLYEMYLDDLRVYSFYDICKACEKFRQNADNKFFPTSGQIRGLIEEIPSWDVISKSKYLAERKSMARDEMAGMVERIEVASGAKQITHEAAE